MRFFVVIFLFFSINTFSQKFQLLEINAKWNKKNNLKQEKLGGIRINFGWLEDQTETFQAKVTSVPVLVLIRDDKPIYQWKAGIDLKLEITEKEFNKIFDKLNEANKKL